MKEVYALFFNRPNTFVFYDFTLEMSFENNLLTIHFCHSWHILEGTISTRQRRASLHLIEIRVKQQQIDWANGRTGIK